jgi:uncharacterized membrane-anchored protein
MYKHRTIIAFVIVALLQLFIPAQMIFHREDILEKGTEFKFQTAPIDPNDPFRGKYTSLNFEQNFILTKDGKKFKDAKEVYVFLKNNQDGFAIFDSISVTKPSEGNNFLKVERGTIQSDRIYLYLPFDRFYMEESKAPKAEKALAVFSTDTLKKAYAIVSVRNGEGVLKDVMIDGKSINEIAREHKGN